VKSQGVDITPWCSKIKRSAFEHFLEYLSIKFSIELSRLSIDEKKMEFAQALRGRKGVFDEDTLSNFINNRKLHVIKKGF